MTECLTFPVSHVDNWTFFLSEVVFTPVLFGLAFMTSLLCILILNTAPIRKAHPAFTYLSALSVVDLLALLCLVPRYIRYSQVLHPEMTYNPVMTYVAGACYVVRHILQHVAHWYIVLAAIVYVMRVKSSSGTKPSWTKISISRIIAFVLCIASTMLNLPRFFEFSVEKVEGHCFEESIFWDLTLTQLGGSVVYKHLYQWIVLGVAFFTPILTLVITNMVLLCRLGCRNLCFVRTCMQESFSDGEREFQLGKCIFIISMLFLTTTIPYTTFEVLDILYGSEKVNHIKGIFELRIVCQTLVFCRLMMPGIVYFMTYGDFRKSLCRSLCCSADEFYEPCACAPRCCSCCTEDESEAFIDSGVLERQRARDNSTLERNARKQAANPFFGHQKKKKQFGGSRWI